MAYSYKRSFTIDHTKVGSTDQTNFPVAFFGTYDGSGGIADLRVVGSGGKVQSSSGYDIQFFSDSALTTPLNFERVVWVGSTGACEFHINVPTVSHTVDTVIYLAYGNASISTDQQNAIATWNTNYKNVYHLPDGSSLSANDSTSSAVNGSLVNTPTPTTGQVDGAAHFVTSSSQYIQANGASISTYPITMEAWVKLSDTSIALNTPRVIACVCDPNALEEFWLDYSNNGSNIIRIVAQSNGAANVFANYYNPTIDTNWHHIVAVWTNATTQILYYDSVALTRLGVIDSGIPPNPTGLTTTFIGALIYNTSNLYSPMNGDIDEVRISNVGRSADWVLSSYNNQSSPSTFYTLGSEVPIGTTVNSGFFMFA